MRPALFVLAILTSAAPAHAQIERPTVFYVVTRAATPAVDPRALPPATRDPYARVERLEATLRDVREHLPRGELRRARLVRLHEALDAARDELFRALRGARARLGAEGWRLLGEAEVVRAQRAYTAAMEAYERDPGSGVEPEPLDLSRAIRAFRLASALAAEDGGAWARYLEAWCALESGRVDDALPALRIVARSGVSALRTEALFRLGELAYDDGRLDLAAAWYERAIPDASEPIRSLAVYKLAWARYRQGRMADALAAIAHLEPTASPELASDLRELRALALDPAR